MNGAEGWIGSWSPRIGDPSIVGWLTVCAYFATAWLCRRARNAARHEVAAGAVHRSAALWTALFALFVVLGVIKQFDLLSAVTQLGRMSLRELGWVNHKRALTEGFAALALVVLLVVATSAAWAARKDARRMALPLLGAAELCAFVIVRSTSHHAMDIFIGSQPIPGIRMNWIMELSGIALVAATAWRFTARRPIDERPVGGPSAA